MGNYSARVRQHKALMEAFPSGSGLRASGRAGVSRKGCVAHGPVHTPREDSLVGFKREGTYKMEN